MSKDSTSPVAVSEAAAACPSSAASSLFSAQLADFDILAGIPEGTILDDRPESTSTDRDETRSAKPNHSIPAALGSRPVMESLQSSEQFILPDTESDDSLLQEFFPFEK